jgi:hypothetical protein
MMHKQEEGKRTFTAGSSSLKQALLELLIQQVIPYLLAYANGSFFEHAKDMQSRYKASEAALRGELLLFRKVFPKRCR